MKLHYEVITAGKLSTNAVLVWNEQSRLAVLIDPTDDARPAIAAAEAKALDVRRILLTHGHFDHGADAERAMEHFGQALSLHPKDEAIYFDAPLHGRFFGVAIEPRTRAVGPVEGGDRITLEPGFELQVIPVPGHSPGSVAYYLLEQGWLFAGDTLFRDGVGRTDLPGGHTRALVRSIQERLYVLPDETIVVPGHGPPTTIGDERRHNPFVRDARVPSCL